MGVSALMWGCDRVFYYPDARIRGTPADHGLAFEDVRFNTADGVSLHGWFMPAILKPGETPRGTVIQFHGNAANLTGHYEFGCWLPEAGYNFFVFDYRGYGQSAGAVSRSGTIHDGEAALDYVRSRADVDQDRVFIIGQSLGGAVSIVTTARRKGQVRGLVVEGTFTRYRDVARYHVTAQPFLLVMAWWYPFFLNDEFDPVDFVADIAPTPLLIIHGSTDGVVPARMGREMYERANEPREFWLVEGMDHYQIWYDDVETAKSRVLAFFDKALSGSSGDS